MLDGIVTGTLPSVPTVLDADARSLYAGRASYTTVLTPKGRMITDGRVLLLGSEEADGFVLELPVAGRAGLVADLRRVLPPRMASFEDVSDARAVLSVVGPEASGLLSELALGGRVAPAALSGLAEGEWRAVGGGGEGGAAAGDALVVMRWADVWPEAFDVLGPVEAVASLRDALTAAGIQHVSAETWNVLRVEAGRPEFGVDMDEDTIPVEAGIHERGIDYGKGCYTGQEVIVRIRDRGHVNRTIELVRLGDVEPPARGTKLFAHGSDKPVGAVTSAVRSPREGETLVLAYVRRGVERLGLKPTR
jgi:hypothetical protein